MFGLAPFAGAPFSSVLQITTSYTPSGLQATGIAGDLTATGITTASITGVSATTSLGVLNQNKGPVFWTSVITEQ